MRKYAENNEKKENGEVMIEGMIVTIITIFVLVWLLGLGFLYYQRYTTTIVANGAAVKVASTYNNPTSDIIMGYVTTEDLSNRDLYRNFKSGLSSSDLNDVNEDRAGSYVKYMLNKANFSGVIKDVDVKLELVSDSIVRKHVELNVTCTYNTPFGEALELFGMGGVNTYSVSSYAECTDTADYASTINFTKNFANILNNKLINSTVGMLNSFVEFYNHKHS